MNPIHYLKVFTIILLQTSSSTFSCETFEDLENDVVHYKIPKGTHKSSISFIKFEGDIFEFEVTFDSTAVYSTVNPANQGDINKLYGFIDCDEEFTPHNYSARFGWRWNDEELQLLSYCYANKKRDSEFLRSIEIGPTYKCTIEITNSSYVFYIDEQKYGEMERGCTNLEVERHLLFPYFGGDELAPHDINIYIKQL